jgi:ketosteroid isomerase-like protein
MSQMSTAEAELRAVELEFEASLVRADAAALDRILADDFRLVDLSGALSTKEAFLQVLQGGELKFVSVVAQSMEVRLYENMAVIVGQTAMHARFRDHDFEVPSRFTHVYVRQGSAWRLVSAQGTVISEH